MSKQLTNLGVLNTISIHIVEWLPPWNITAVKSSVYTIIYYTGGQGDAFMDPKKDRYIYMVKNDFQCLL